MVRVASVMQVFEGQYEEYKKRHDLIWPELAQTLKEYGASNYSIFLDENTGKLFAYLEVVDEDTYRKISETAICQKWWTYMKDIMETNDDFSPVAVPLREVFHLN